jgi:hypothetical protein
LKKRPIFILLLVFLLVLCQLPMAEAQHAAQNIFITFTQAPTDLFIGEKITVQATLSGVSENAVVQACWKFDDQIIPGYFNSRFTLEDGKISTLCFVVPHGLGLGSNHTISFCLQDENGKTIEQKTQAVQINSFVPRMRVSFSERPEYIEESGGAHYTVTFWHEIEGRTFCVPVSLKRNEQLLTEFTRTIELYSGMTQTIYVPGEGLHGSHMRLSYLVNHEGIWGIDQQEDTVWTPIYNNDYQKKAQTVMEKVKPVLIAAGTTVSTGIYADANLTLRVGTLAAGTALTYIHPDSGYIMKAGYVRTQNGETYWVPLSNIWISKINYTIPDDLSFEEKEIFVNEKGYSSKTYYLVWVNLQRQIVNVYLGTHGNWRILKTFPCATGKNATPTPTEEFEYTSLTDMWRFSTYYCAPVLNLRSGYAFHCQPTYYNGIVKDPTMGRPASLGCIRMYFGDVDWMRAWVPIHTKVVVY